MRKGRRRTVPPVGAQPVGPFARHDGGSNASPEVGIKLSSDRGHFVDVIRKAGPNGPPGLGKAGAIHSNFGASTGARRHKPGLPIFPVRATSALLDRVRAASPDAVAPFRATAGVCGLRRPSSRTFKRLGPTHVGALPIRALNLHPMAAWATHVT
jgi:hypothetical protein